MYNIIVWVGDSRGIIIDTKQDKVILSTEDHKPTNLSEKSRCSSEHIDAEFGYLISKCGTHKSPLQLLNKNTGAATGMTRSIGTPLAPSACISTPMVKTTIIPHGTNARIVVRKLTQ